MSANDQAVAYAQQLLAHLRKKNSGDLLAPKGDKGPAAMHAEGSDEEEAGESDLDALLEGDTGEHEMPADPNGEMPGEEEDDRKGKVVFGRNKFTR